MDAPYLRTSLELHLRSDVGVVGHVAADLGRTRSAERGLEVFHRVEEQVRHPGVRPWFTARSRHTDVDVHAAQSGELLLDEWDVRAHVVVDVESRPRFGYMTLTLITVCSWIGG